MKRTGWQNGLMCVGLLIGGLLCGGLLISTAEAQELKAKAGDWPWWRGPNFNGQAEAGQKLPVKWTNTQNVGWKVEIPGRGHASPTVVGDRIYLATADDKTQVQSVLCLDRATGQQKWKETVSQGGFPRNIHPKNTHATGTVACDGQRLFAVFHNHDGVQVTALDLQGKQQWQKVIGSFAPRQYQYGYAPSPTLYQNLVIVAADFDGGGYLCALDRQKGEVVWKQSRPARLSYSSPVVAHVSGRDQLLISGCDLVASYDPLKGTQLWSVPATSMATCGTMVWNQDTVFASGGYPKPETVAIKGDGSGKVLWRNNQKCYEQSMLAFEGHIYVVTDAGVAYCWKAETGDELWKARLRGPVSASPILAGGNIYASVEAGTTYVFRASPAKFELLAENQLGNEAFATPSICNNQIFLRVADSVGGRRQEYLYCLQLSGAE